MRSRVIMFIVLLVTLNTFCEFVGGSDDDKQRNNGHCGLVAARYVLKSFSIPFDRCDLSKLEKQPNASLLDLRTVFEQAALKVDCYDSTRASYSSWSSLNLLVRTRNAIVLVLAGTPHETVGHYYFLGNVTAESIELIDPLTTTAIIRPIVPQTDSDPVLSIVVYHPKANALTLPISQGQFGFLIVLCVIVLGGLIGRYCLYGRKQTTNATLTICAVSLSCVIGCSSPSQVVLEDANQDLGVVALGDEAVVNSNLRNDSRRTIELSAIELSCSCLSTDFTPGPIQPSSVYRFQIKVEGTSLGRRSQGGYIIFRSHDNSVQKVGYQLNYFVGAEYEIYPNPYSLGIVESEVLSAGIPFQIAIHDANGNAVKAKVVAMEIVSYSGMHQPKCCVSIVDDNNANRSTLVFSANEGQGAFEASLLTVVQVEDVVKKLPLNISGRSIEKLNVDEPTN